MFDKIAAISALMAVVRAQGKGQFQQEDHPPLTWQKCTAEGSCSTVQGSIVLDANWRWTHDAQGTNCYTGNTWDSTRCPNNAAGASNCFVDGADYSGTYGITTSGNALTLKFVTQSQQKNVGSRVYLLADENTYEEFPLLNHEFTFDVDVSQLPCGLNGALYFSSMDADAGVSKYPGNTAGAAYGTGYCDSQCPRDLKFINGQANCEGWVPSSNNQNTGIGDFGSCCSEMDVWEANSMSNAVTPHPCDTVGQTMCNGDSCGGTYSPDRYAGECDPDGCDLNPFRGGNHDFYGPGMTVDTTKPFTVKTQFVESGSSVIIKRLYIQNGQTFQSPDVQNLNGFSGNDIEDAYCTAEEAGYGGNSFTNHGGLQQMSKALAQGMVLVMSLWDDYSANMWWLDSTYPTNETQSTPGAYRGTCSTTSGDPATVENQSPNAQVIYSNIRFGPINSTTSGTGSPAPGNGNGSSSSSSSSSVPPPATSTHTSTHASDPASTPTSTHTSTHTSTTAAPPAASTTKCTEPPAPSSTSPSSGSGQVHWGQCGGIGWTGPTTCVSPFTCQMQNDWYFQCV